MSSGGGGRIVLAVIAAILVVGCGLAVVLSDEVGCRVPLVECLETEAEGELFVRNDRVDAVTVRADSSSFMVSPGQMRTLAGLGCRGSALIATDTTGAEVSRLAPEAECVTRTWIFHADGTAQVVPGRAEQ